MIPVRTLRQYFFAACVLSFALGAQAGDKYKVKEVPYVEPQDRPPRKH